MADLYDSEKYKNDYTIRADGSVYSIKSKKKLKPWLRNGYCHVCLCKNGIVEKFKVHRLVAHTFLSNPENKPEVNHINFIRHDNRVENLEWCTPKENVRHTILNGRATKAVGKDNGRCKLSSQQVRVMKWILKINPKFKLSILREMFQISIGSLYQIKHNKSFKYITV